MKKFKRKSKIRNLYAIEHIETSKDTWKALLVIIANKDYDKFKKAH